MFRRILRNKWVWLGMLAVTVMVMLAVWFSSFIGPKDVTFDPQYGFAPIAGTVWKTKTELVVVEIDGLNLERLDSFTSEHYRKTLANPNYCNGGVKILAILPPGNRVQIDKLIDSRGSLGVKIVHGKLIDGTFAGKDMTIADTLFLKNDITSPGRSLPRQWEVSPEFLEPP